MTREEILAVAKPILFNTDMTIAILENRKGVTRRIVKNAMQFDDKCDNFNVFRKKGWIGPVPRFLSVEMCAPYHEGDILYVRETWTKLFYSDENGYTHYDQLMYYYAADGVPDITLVDADGFEEDDQRIRWRPSIHMPKEAARIFLRVADVWVERLQDMTLDDFLAEGVVLRPEAFNDPDNAYWQARNAFSSLWDATIAKKDLAKYGWDANPWVWVIEFERVEV